MKKFFLILLLFVLPLQMSWAAASAYCLHEEGKAAQHPGHHSHQHKASADTGDGEHDDRGRDLLTGKQQATENRHDQECRCDVRRMKPIDEPASEQATKDHCNAEHPRDSHRS